MAVEHVRIKPGVKISPRHFSVYPVAHIVAVVAEIWPSESSDGAVVITRGFEDCPGSKVQSRHKPPFFAAFDFRTRNLAPEIDRRHILRLIQRALGPEYYAYYKRYVDAADQVVEWIHVQWNGRP